MRVKLSAEISVDCELSVISNAINHRGRLELVN